ncbi:NACHT domain-containing NTPase [Mucilaginibacter sp. OAE612]|uniref:NACHT domain-containing protein n=1 Tax=Mucilaginibacter sp. OAE612 TaxID=3156444 RepID=UPI0035A02ACD
MSKSWRANVNEILVSYHLPSFSEWEFVVIICISVMALVLLFANYILQDKTVMKEHDNSFDDSFPEREFTARLKSFCNFLENRIDVFDNEANWSDAHFTSLDAEVETLTSKGKKRRVTNLLKAIRNNYSSKVFLVLGDPGSGKSVALRKLCRDLIKEVLPTRKIPIYLNLKEWYTTFKWDEHTPPTPDDLYKFCLNSLKGKDIFADEFLDKYFKRLYENGHLFFIVDSFDEIPAVLDVDESSWLIDKLSEILFSFLGGAHESRGVLASRYFRKPTAKFKSGTVLNVRPFSHLKINDALNKYISIDKEIIKLIFSQRSDLLPIASNPFAVGLIHSYLKDNDNKLPENQADLFSSYIDSRLKSSVNYIKRSGLTQNIIKTYATEIALYMLHKVNFGLEVSLDEVKDQFPEVNIETVLDILVYARIGRIGRGEEKRFSFVHRRFNEYFVVQKFLLDPSLIDIESIPVDSRFRDALVLYCEIAPEDMAVKIAEYCWCEIQIIDYKDTNQFKRSVHCLRFIIEAYRLRLNLLSAFRNELSDQIIQLIKDYDNQQHPLLVKIAVEATGILEQEKMQYALYLCFNINNWWINQTAIGACRYLSAINKMLENKILAFVKDTDYFEFLLQKNELVFAMSLSESFRIIKKYIIFRYVDIVLFITVVAFVIIINPAVGLLLIVTYFSAKFMSNIVRNRKRSNAVLTMLRPFMAFLMILYSIPYSMPLRSGKGMGNSASKLFFAKYYKMADSYWWVKDVFPQILIYFSIVLAVVMLFPTFDFCYSIKSVRDRLKLRKLTARKFINKIVSFFGAAFIASSIVGALIYLLVTLLAKYNLEDVLLYLLLFCFLISLVWLSYVFVKDCLKFQKMKQHRPNISRNKIALDYNSFKLEFFKKRFVLNLQSYNNVPHDNWPNGFRLTGNANSIIILAQLDEKWLGLD